MTVSAKLHATNIRLADDFHEDGIFGFHCHDLTQFGSVGASIATSRGRYVWIFSADHPTGGDGTPLTGTWNAGSDFLIGYSDDPGVPPKSPQVMVPSDYRSGDSRDAADKFLYYHYNDLVFNPDDATFPFYLYCEGFVFQGPDAATSNNHESGLLRSSDLITWVGFGFTHTGAFGSTSFQRVKRRGAGDWISVGNIAAATRAIWTSTDALTWTTNGVALNRVIGAKVFAEPFGQPLTISISGQDYFLMQEDARNADGGMYASLVPVDSTFNVIDTGTPPVTRLTAKHEGVFPSFSYLQDTNWYLEDGILHFWVSRGYFNDTAPNPADGQHEQTYDYYTAIIDATAAADAAPIGVRAECLKGAVVLSWYDALPNQTYRVQRSTNGGSSYSTLADVTGLHYVDTAGDMGSVYLYKVITLNAGVEKGLRTVSTYVSNALALTNEHVTRVTAAGATDINVAWLDTVVGWLRDNTLTDNVLFWADPSFGVIKNGGAVVSAVFCLGSTIHPRGGDWRPKTGSTATTYSATGVNSNVPAWVGSTSTAHGYFGNTRVNNFRRKVETTFCAVYQKSHTNTVTFLATSEFEGISLQHASGSPGSVNFNLIRSGHYSVTASGAPASATTAHIVIGTFDGITALNYLDGVAGSPATGVVDTLLLDGQRGGVPTQFLGTGSLNVKHNEDDDAFFNTSGYVFSDAQAQFNAAAEIVFDIGLSPVQAVSLNTLLTARINGASYSLPAYDVPLVKNIVTDYSAAGVGADDASAFNTFSSDALTWQATHTGLVVLQIPPGDFRFQTSVGNSKFFTRGIKHFLLLGEDRSTSILSAGLTDQGYFLGCASSMHFDNTHSARINTVASGATSVVLVSAGDASLFAEDGWLLVAGIDLQGFGDPPNPGFFEWHKIIDITGGTITLDGPLEYGYKSTWPLFNAGSAFNSDLGGPATVYVIKDEFDCEHEYRHIAIAQPDVQTKAPGRFITFTNVSASGAGIFPTENFHWTANDLVQTDLGMEIDKIIGTATVKGGVIKSIAFQSTSPNKFEMKRGAFVTNDMLSTPRKAYLDGFYIAGESRFGTGAYGCTEKVVAINGTIGSTGIGGVAETGIVAAGFSMSGGVITVNKSGHGPVQWANPGSQVLWTGDGRVAVNSFRIVDVSESGGNVVITTDQADGFLSDITGLGVRTHPCPNMTIRGVCDPIVDLSKKFGFYRNLSRCQPFVQQYSRSFHRYIEGNINAPVSFPMFGQIVSVTVAVSTAYTGPTNPLLEEIFGQFGAFVVLPDGTSVLWDPKVDLRTAHTLILTPAGPSGNAGGDTSLTPPDDLFWFADTISPHLATNISGDAAGPIVTSTFILDQSTMTADTGSIRVFVCRFV